MPAEAPHDHSPSAAIAAAEQLCATRGQNLTELRRSVLRIICAAERPIGAYAILDQLRSEGRSGAPPTVYRTLDFLLEQGLVHRLASLNAFVACCDPAERHGGQFLICEACGRVGELNSVRVETTIVEEAAAVRFAVSAQTVEVLGRCAACLRLPAGPSA